MSEIDWAAIAAVLEAIAWPLLVLFGLILLKEPISRFLSVIGNRISKVSVAGVSLELTRAHELSPGWNVGDKDVRSLTPALVFDSGSESLFKELYKGRGADYAVIDLGDGRKWLTSRLYLFAAMLGSISGVQRFVFVAKQGEITRKFIGMASPPQICRALAQAYPWLEDAFLRARVEPAPFVHNPINPVELGDLAAKQPFLASQVARRFLDFIQRPPAPDPYEGWVALPSLPDVSEHGSWIGYSDLEELLGSHLQTEAYTHSPDILPGEAVKGVLRRPGEFAARINPGGRFLDLVDRLSLMEALAKQHAFQES